ncbi:hypothetical protein Lp19_1126 [Lactiplantibacillus plantarum]|uniref:Uncharacterized protein n=1 Tax=Lactiplantibacillus plantarum TaxID=1590 RepID=A0A162ERM3_LACPN|nr:hypothetical protein Lp19_1126 [Lactiplantibacillus plantarum]
MAGLASLVDVLSLSCEWLDAGAFQNHGINRYLTVLNADVELS